MAKAAVALQLRLQAIIERKAIPKLNREFRRVARESAKGYREDGILGAMTVMPSHVENLTNILVPVWTEAITTFGRLAFDMLGKRMGATVETKDAEGDLDRAIVEWLERYGTVEITEISETTRRMILDVIEVAAVSETSVAAVSGQINNILGGSARNRSVMIARTETHGSAMFGSMEGARSTGLELVKEWNSVEDDRTRRGHFQMDGKQVGMDDTFFVPESSPGRGDEANMIAPGDPSAPAGQVINCRCALTYDERL